MPGDPHQCRRYAARCLALAHRARNSKRRQNFAALAETWAKLAAEMESDQGLFAVLQELELVEPNYAVPLALNLSPALPGRARLMATSHNYGSSPQATSGRYDHVVERR